MINEELLTVTAATCADVPLRNYSLTYCSHKRC